MKLTKELATPEKRKAKVLELYESGLLPKEIRNKTGLSLRTIDRYLGTLKRPKVTNAMLSEMLCLYQEIENWSQVARELETTPQVINYWRKLAKARKIC